MTENSNMHWTDNDELLSKYVLHHLDPVEEARLAAHLKACEACRIAVTNEQRIIAGTRLAGRTALKERLNARLELNQRAIAGVTPARSNIPWMRVASLAAVFLVLVTVGVYNNWFDANTWNKSEIPEQAVHEQPQQPIETESKENADPSPDTRTRDDLAALKSSVEKDHSDKNKLRKTEQSTEKGALDKSDDRFAESPSVAPAAAGAELSAVEERKMENEILLTDQATITSPQTFWVEGRIISTETSQRDEKRVQPLAESQGQTNVFRQDPSRLKKDAGQPQQSRMNTTANISLSQMPSSALPAALQRKQSQLGTVQAFIQSQANNIQMTIYLDSPMPDSELQAAGVETIGEDSLILNLPNQRIGYKLPPALQSQVNTKAKR